jgi:subtilisin-like proprotein convertase family protein
MTYASPRGRNRLALVLATALVALGAAAGSASAATKTFTNSSPITIPDEGASTPYPSSINVSGFPGGNVLKATVTIRDFEHTHTDDAAILLVGPSGANSILLGRSGGAGNEEPVTVTFDQAAASEVPSPITSGTFRPTSGVDHDLEPLSFPAPGFPYPVDLNAFNGKPADGTWQLFVDDQAAGDTGSIGAGWSLNISAPVNTVTAGKPKLNKKKGTAQVPVTVADAGQLTLSGKGVKTASATKAKAVAGPGTVKLTVKPKGKTRSKLNSTGKATVKVTITFTPTGGTPNVTTKKIKLKKTG